MKQRHDTVPSELSPEEVLDGIEDYKASKTLSDLSAERPELAGLAQLASAERMGLLFESTVAQS